MHVRSWEVHLGAVAVADEVVGDGNAERDQQLVHLAPVQQHVLRRQVVDEAGDAEVELVLQDVVEQRRLA